MGIKSAYVLPHPPLIIPAVGRGAEERIRRTFESCEEAARRAARARPDTVVVSSPHAPVYRDAFHLTTASRLEGTMASFGAPEEKLSFECDRELAEAVADEARSRGLAVVGSRFATEEMDHATFIPLWFLARAWKEAGFGPLPRVVRVGISGLGFEAHRALGSIVARKAEETGRAVVWIASGDLSHKLKEDGPYGFDPAGPVFDERVCEAFESGRLEDLFGLDPAFCEQAAECGLRSFLLMAGSLQDASFSSELLSHEDLGVGYAVAAFEALDGEDPVLKLARWAVRRSVIDGSVAPRPAWTDAGLLEKRAGVFVSLHEQGRLRGCIGTIAPTRENIADEILRNAFAASHEDPRFPPVEPDELGDLEVSVDVLGEPEPAELGDLDPKRYGVIVSKGWRRGLLLPDLEGVDTVDSQVAIAKTKAGIRPDEEGVRLERFEVVRHGE